MVTWKWNISWICEFSEAQSREDNWLQAFWHVCVKSAEGWQRSRCFLFLCFVSRWMVSLYFALQKIPLMHRASETKLSQNAELEIQRSNSLSSVLPLVFIGKQFGIQKKGSSLHIFWLVWLSCLGKPFPPLLFFFPDFSKQWHGALHLHL